MNADISLKTLLPFGEVTPPVSPGSRWLTKWDDRNPSGEPLDRHDLLGRTTGPLVYRRPGALEVGCGQWPLSYSGTFSLSTTSSRHSASCCSRTTTTRNSIESAGIPGLSVLGTDKRGDQPPAPARRPFEGMFGKLRLWARNKEAQKFDAEACESGALDDVAIRLDGLRRLINTKEDGPATKLVGRIWRILNDTAAIVRPLTRERTTASHSTIDAVSPRARGQQSMAYRPTPNPRCPCR